MSDTRYEHGGTSRGSQDQRERKDEGWTSRQGGDQSRDPGREGTTSAREAGGSAAREGDRSLPPPATNTQGELAGIGEASRETGKEVDRRRESPSTSAPPDQGSGRDGEERDAASGTDQPRRMGGPLGPDPEHPRLPEGAQNADTRGTGAGGFDRGVDASNVGAVHQGVKEEDVRDARD